MKYIKYLIIFCFAFSICILSFNIFSDKETSNIIDLTDKDYILVVVEEGDTIWNIAKPYYDGKSDYRNLINNIKKVNNLDQSIIYPGQKLVIPLL